MYHMRQAGLLRRPPDPSVLCLDWYHNLRHQESNSLEFLVCPCNKELLKWDWFWLMGGPPAPAPDENTECYDSVETRREFTNTVVWYMFVELEHCIVDLYIRNADKFFNICRCVIVLCRFLLFYP